MSRQVVLTNKAPAPFAPFSQAIKANGFVFVTGQVGIDPDTGQLVAGGVEAQARQALESIAAILEAAGSSMKHVVKTTIFLTAIGDYERVNKVYETFFPDAPPARSTLMVAGLGGGELIEIEAIAVLNEREGE